ncbi:MAG: cobyrinate a,c-diamide synthase [Hyphomicrobiaceae bacterium]|nr:cobyrinate a,c-diamide synthase [Hyphomicrobiaceae bacterium]
MAQILIAAAHKSSGKTTVTLGLARALRNQGLTVQTFKKGPDYIDPMWHARATGRPAYNLDFNTQSHSEIIDMLAARSNGADISLIEANMGLYDGVDLEGRDGNAALAKLTSTPVILVVDTEGMTRGIAPLLLGYRVFDPEVHLAGVVLNRVAGARHEEKLRAAVERYTEVPVIGALPREQELMLPERHLGLTTPAETDAVEAFIARIGERVAARFDLETVKGIAKLAPPPFPPMRHRPSAPATIVSDQRVKIAVARDAAFGFYYPDDLEAFRAAGADLGFFDAMRDQHLPAADGLFIGGGFPETHMAALEANATLRAEIRAAIENGLPTYAECGGLMYLTRAIRWGEARAEMVGVIDAEAVMHVKPQGRGQVIVAETEEFPWPEVVAHGQARRDGTHAHEFHHAALVQLSADTRYALEMRRGTGIDGRHDGILVHNTLAAFSHQRATAANPWVERFVAFVRQVRAGVGQESVHELASVTADRTLRSVPSASSP